MRILRLGVQALQDFLPSFCEFHLSPALPTSNPELFKLCSYNGRVSFRVRESRREDFESLWRVDQECFPPGIAYSRMELRVYMRRSRAFTLVGESVADPAQPSSSVDIVGFIVAEAAGKQIGHIITIDVLAPARRTGLGSQLLSAAEARLRAAGCRAVYLETAVDNHSALAFYKRHAYMISKTVPRYYSNQVDAFVLTKQL